MLELSQTSRRIPCNTSWKRRKSLERSVAEAAVQGHKFGVLHIHNQQETPKKKGVDLPNACQILEICNPQKAKEVLTEDMNLIMALPCRVSVYSEGGKTKIVCVASTTKVPSIL